MIDLNRRQFLFQSLKLSAAATAALATYPAINIYQEKVLPVVNERFPEQHLPTPSSFDKLKAFLPQLLSSATVFSLVMMYADNLEMLALVLVAALSLLFIGIPITELSLSYFL
jgi:hypothetical protein|tara:strand:+ start:611 stop:949 length:339 start_codon:yes stop_codon:yes gene_type:complete